MSSGELARLCLIVAWYSSPIRITLFWSHCLLVRVDPDDRDDREDCDDAVEVGLEFDDSDAMKEDIGWFLPRSRCWVSSKRSPVY